MKNILIVDDDRSIRHILKEALSGEKFNTDIVQDAESAIKLIEKNPIDLVITDLMMPGITGLEMMDKVKPNYPDIGFIFMTAFGTVDVAVDALKKGAFDFVTKKNLRLVLFLKFKSSQKIIDIIIIAIVKWRDNR